MTKTPKKKPASNKRSSRSVPVQKAVAMMTGTDDPMVGHCFVTLNDAGRVSRQGMIVNRVEPDRYLVQLFEWFAGSPSTMKLIHINELTSPTLNQESRANTVELFEDDEEMRNWLEHGPGQHLQGEPKP